jgi:GlcNAc-P-P-Und epimerase
MAERAVIFGGAGFIGRHVATSLLQRGYSSVVLADIDYTTQPKVPGATEIRCDVREPIPDDLSPGTTEVYNLAAIHTTPGHPDHEYFETNVPGAKNVTEWCARNGVRKVWFTSSIAVYGPCEEPRYEDSDLVPVSAYGKSKLEAEQIHRAWADQHEDNRLVTVRPAVMFGPGEHGNFTRLAKALKLRIFFYTGRRDTIKACGWVKDLVASFEYAMGLDHKAFLYNFCYPDDNTIEDVCRAYNAAGGLALPLGTIPRKALDAVAVGFEVLAKLGKETGINRARVAKLCHSTWIKPKALQDSGFVWGTDLTAALRAWKEDAGVFE